MRRPRTAVLLFLLVVAGYAVAGFAVTGVATGAASNSAPAEHVTASGTDTVTVAGQVTDEDGQPVADAYVLIESTPTERLDDALDGRRTIDESLLRFGMADVDGVTVARTDDEGRFTAAVSADEYAVIAVTEEAHAVSALRTVEAAGDRTTVDLVVDRHQVVTADRNAPNRIAPGETATVTVGLDNPDDRAVESLSMNLSLPDGWTVEAVETDGDWDADARELHWETVPVGERVEAALTVRVPEDAERGSYEVELTADGESHFVEYTGYDGVNVLPPGATPSPTPIEHGVTSTPPLDQPAGDGSSTESTDTPADGTPTETPASAPGFGVVGAVVALALLAARRR